MFGIVPWCPRWQRPQHFAAQLAKRGHRVVYITPHLHTQEVDWLRLDESTGLDRILLAQLPALTVETVHTGDPWPYDEVALCHHALHTMIRELRLRCPILVAQTPGWWPLLEMLRERCAFPLVYDCMDEHTGWNHETAETMRAYELALAANADLALASSEMLQRRLSDVCNPHLVPNGCDYERFTEAANPNGVLAAVLKRPIIGYYGALSHSWFDTALLLSLAHRRPDWSFVTIGPTDSDVGDSLDTAPNILQLGPVEYHDLPRYAADFDVAIIPFLVNGLTKATDPVKLYEYFASGKPVVATPMPELYQFQGLLTIATTPEEFENAIAGFLIDPHDRNARQSVAQGASWQNRVGSFAPSMLACRPSLDVVILAYNNADLTRTCLDSVITDTSYPAQIIVVDNASTDHTLDVLREFEPHEQVTIIRNDVNVGFAAAVNQGVKAGAGQYVLLLNNDTILPTGSRIAFANALARDRSVALVGPVTNSIGNEAKIYVPYDPVTPEAITAFAMKLSWDRFGASFDIPVAALFAAAFRRADFDTAGGIPERYQVGMFEDDEFSENIRLLGKRVVCHEDIFVHHAGGAAFSSLDPVVYRAIFDHNRRVFERTTGQPWAPHRYRVNQREPVASGPVTAKGEMLTGNASGGRGPCAQHNSQIP